MKYQIATIKSTDDQNLILLSENNKKSDKNSDIKLYINAETTDGLFNVWKNTYDGQILGDVIFCQDTKAYEIGIKPLLKRELKDFDDSGKIINGFEEILRHNNVSDKENAFNRLIALFICKLVDEITKTDDDVVEFQYKVGTDTYETLQDRLQRLHKEGMDKFMKEEILYISDDYPDNIIQQYTNKSNRDELIKDLKQTIRILKFYTNNDFAFKDVHNKELFYQNGKLLVEVIELFQNYKIIGSNKLQLLGDLFEKLLDKGFKQNEGQFFTPTPITRFIWKSLPLDKIIFENGKHKYPKIIDYACGAGHFLTEGIEEIKQLLTKKNIKEENWYKDNIYGIEKDYRLSRVSKVSMYMHGAGDSNIIFGDGLENDKGVENNLFDILVANPPYSVKGFKPHLNLKNNKLDIIDYISNDGSEIEVCFVERISQLLKPKGIASVILPSSLLSNISNSYVKAREIILKNFYIRGITSFGNLTFGATGTNTVVLFLEKFNEPPKKMYLHKDSVNAIFNNENLDEWEDKEILTNYLNQIDVDIDFYKSFISQKLLLSKLKRNKHFSIYVQSYGNSSDVVKLLNSKSYKKLNKKEQYAKYLENLYKYISPIEREKVFYFSLIYKQKTIIVKSPTDNKPQQEFLGYKWSNRKGAEGIQIIKMGGKLFDPAHNDYASDYIRNSFNSDYLPDSEYSKCVNTKNMIDFSRDTFNKEFNLSNNKSTNIFSKYLKVELNTVASLKGGDNFDPNYQGNTNNTYIPFYKVGDMNISGNEYWMNNASNYVDFNTLTNILKATIFDVNTIIFPKVGMAIHTNKKRILSRQSAIDNNTMAVWSKDNKILLPLYLYEYLVNFVELKNYSSESNPPSISQSNFGKLLIPLPPLQIQQQIVADCNKIENNFKKIKNKINKCNRIIEKIFKLLDKHSSQGQLYRLDNNTYFDLSIGKRVLNKQLVQNANIPVYSANVKEPFGYINQLLSNLTNFTTPSILWGIDGDWMTNYIPANLKFYPTDHCGVLRCNTPNINPYYLCHILETEGTKLGFSRSLRASLDRVKNITFKVCSRKYQDKMIARIEILNQMILQLSNSLKSYDQQIKKVLEKYL